MASCFQGKSHYRKVRFSFLECPALKVINIGWENKMNIHRQIANLKTFGKPSISVCHVLYHHQHILSQKSATFIKNVIFDVLLLFS
jgi:hypothetical protein